MSRKLRFVVEVARGLLFISLVAVAVPLALFGHVLTAAGLNGLPMA